MTSPATSNRSLSDTGRPSTGERRTPRLAQPIGVIGIGARRVGVQLDERARAFACRRRRCARAPARRARGCVVRPAARSAPSWATVHMRRNCSGHGSAHEWRASFRRQLLYLPRRGARAYLRGLRRGSAAPRAPACPRCALASPAAWSAAAASRDPPRTTRPSPRSPTSSPPTRCPCAQVPRRAGARAAAGGLLAPSLGEERIDCIVPLPLSARRLRGAASTSRWKSRATSARHARHRRSASARADAPPQIELPSTSGDATCAALFAARARCSAQRSRWSTM